MFSGPIDPNGRRSPFAMNRRCREARPKASIFATEVSGDSMDEGPSNPVGETVRALLDACLDAVFILDSRAVVLHANRTAVGRYGYSLDELKGTHAGGPGSGTHAEPEAGRFAALLAAGEPFEWVHRSKDGREIPVEVGLSSAILGGGPCLVLNVRPLAPRRMIEAVLEDKSHFLERLLDSEPGTVYLFDLRDRGNRYLNRHFFEVFGYSPEEVRTMGSDLIGLIHPDDRSRVDAHHAAWSRASDGEIRSVEYRFLDKQGRWHWLLSHEVPFSRNEDGTVGQILGVAEETTGRKHSETLLLGQSRLLERVASGATLSDTLAALVRFIEEQAPGMMGSILLADDEGRRLHHGAAPSLPPGFVRAIDGLEIGPESGSCGTAAWRREPVHVKDIASDPLWTRFRAEALSNGLASCWSTPIMDGRGRLFGTFAMYYRIPISPPSEHLALVEPAIHIASIAIAADRAMKELREKASMLAQAQKVARLGFFQHDLETGRVSCSEEFRRMFEIPGSEEYTTTDTILEAVHPDDLDVVKEHLAGALRGDSLFRMDHRLRHSDGTILWVHADGELMNGPSGVPRFLIGTAFDITDRKIAEDRLHRITRLYSALSQCNQAIVRCTGEAELFSQVCRDAVVFGGLKMAWIGMVTPEGSRVRPVASYGAGTLYLDGLDLPLSEDDPAGHGPTARSIRDNRPCWIRDFQHDPSTSRWHERGADFGWGSSASLPLTRRGVPVGAFSLYSGEVDGFDEAAKTLLLEMAMDLSFALDRFLSESERKQALEDLRVSELRQRTIIETEPECVKVVDPAGYLLEMNGAGLAMLEADSFSQAREKRLIDFILPEYQEAFRMLHQRVMEGKSETLEFELMGLRGTRRWLETHAAPLTGASGEIVGMLGITRDITSRRLSEARIQYLANFDALTGLPNRNLLADRLRYALSMEKRSGGALTVMFIDLDRFKEINDTLGHNAGDAFLVEVGQRLREVLREEDTASRMGGDEFVLVLPECDALGAAHVAQKLAAAISRPFRIDPYEVVVTASIGIAIYPHDGTDFETLSKCADTAMYRAKQDGRNSFRFFTAEMQSHSVRNMELVSAMRHALARGEFHLHYQPQISLRDGRLIGVEALLRWTHPELGTISPGEFIPVAEECRLIVPIGEWVMQTAVAQLKQWMKGGHLPIVVVVNLSAVQFRQRNLPEMVQQILDAARVSGEYLELELTESAAMHDPEGAIAIMNDLRSRGIRMSIDDFGTGYSSMNYLKKFSVYKLKIDQSFVRDISFDPEDQAIVSAIIRMSQSLGLETIAEGVETAEQVAFLKERGCDEAQGYYFARPLPSEQVESFFSRNLPEGPR